MRILFQLHHYYCKELSMIFIYWFLYSVQNPHQISIGNIYVYIKHIIHSLKGGCSIFHWHEWAWRLFCYMQKARHSKEYAAFYCLYIEIYIETIARKNPQGYGENKLAWLLLGFRGSGAWKSQDRNQYICRIHSVKDPVYNMMTKVCKIKFYYGFCEIKF